jgi:hypothetical protein
MWSQWQRPSRQTPCPLHAASPHEASEQSVPDQAFPQTHLKFSHTPCPEQEFRHSLRSCAAMACELARAVSSKRATPPSIIVEEVGHAPKPALAFPS